MVDFNLFKVGDGPSPYVLLRPRAFKSILGIISSYNKDGTEVEFYNSLGRCSYIHTYIHIYALHKLTNKYSCTRTHTIALSLSLSLGRVSKIYFIPGAGVPMRLIEARMRCEPMYSNMSRHLCVMGRKDIEI